MVCKFQHIISKDFSLLGEFKAPTREFELVFIDIWSRTANQYFP